MPRPWASQFKKAEASCSEVTHPPPPPSSLIFNQLGSLDASLPCACLCRGCRIGGLGRESGTWHPLSLLPLTFFLLCGLINYPLCLGNLFHTSTELQLHAYTLAAESHQLLSPITVISTKTGTHVSGDKEVIAFIIYLKR